MALQFSSTGLVSNGNSPFHLVLSFIDSVLRGIGQVMLQNNSYTGLLFLIGIFYNSALFGFAALLGTVVSTATALIFKASRAQVRDGLFGFNGALVAIALTYFLKPDVLTWSYVIFASATSTIFMAATLRTLRDWQLPTLTAPFVFVSLCFLLACARFGQLHPTYVLPTAGLPTAATVEGIVTASTVFEGFLNGIAQVFFQGNLVTGALFALGLLVSSRQAFSMAILGSLVGLLTAWGLGAAEPAIRSGAFGFNSVLTAIAMAAYFSRWSAVVVAYNFFAILATTIAFAATSAALEPLGMPALTLPFVLVTWLFILASSQLPQLQELSVNYKKSKD